jgi:hypothetical protein
LTHLLGISTKMRQEIPACDPNHHDYNGLRNVRFCLYLLEKMRQNQCSKMGFGSFRQICPGSLRGLLGARRHRRAYGGFGKPTATSPPANVIQTGPGIFFQKVPVRYLVRPLTPSRLFRNKP